VIACSVRYRRAYGDQPGDQLSKNARYANDLGAEVVHVEGRRIAEQLVRLARERNGHTIVIGRSPAYARWIPWREDIVRGINRRAPDLNVHIAASGTSGDSTPDRGFAGTNRLVRNRVSREWVSLGPIMITAVGLSMVVDGLSGRDADTIMILLAGVLFSSALGDRMSGLLSSVLAVLSFNFFFTEPRYTLVVDDSSYLITFPVMLVVAFVTSELTSRLNASVDLARTREKRAETLYRNSEQLLSARGVATISETVGHNLTGLLQRKVDVTVSREHSSGGNDTPDGPGTVFHVATETETFGLIRVYDQEQPLSVGSVALVNAFAAQLAIALDRERLTLAEEAARLHAERERIRVNLLRSVSHDLRTPLSSIAGAASVLLQLDVVPEAHRQLLQDIESDAMWLSEIVENILSLTRLNDDTLSLHSSEEVLEDIVLEAVERVARRTGRDFFDVRFPEDIILVEVDVPLVEQMLMNILGNAVDFTRGTAPIIIRAETDNTSSVHVTVRDHGPGLPEDEMERVFELFYTRKKDVDSRRGLGVGLTVAKTIAELHGGTISMTNAPSDGLEVTVCLPARRVASTGEY
jgi:two-component system, OmpR family, sensor histidine kinase KdpD